MSSVKVNRIIGFIMSNDMMDLDYMDVQSMCASDVLKHFGIDESLSTLSEVEQAQLMADIEKLAGQVQTGEIVRSVFEA